MRARLRHLRPLSNLFLNVRQSLLSFNLSKTLSMESGGNCTFSDWNRPFSDQELEAIEAAFQSATSSSSSSPIKRRHVPSRTDDIDGPTVRRRLPGSIAVEFTDDRRCRYSSPMRSSSLLPCPTSRNFNAYYSSSPATPKMRYTKMTFKGRIAYCRTVSEVEKAAKELLEFVETKKRESDPVILGVDIEWKPTFRKGVSPGKVAVVQICGDTSHCYVLHIFHSGIPQNLRSLLEDPSSVKVGVGIRNDAVKFSKDHSVSIMDVEDLSYLANQKLGGGLNKWSMGSLTESVICKQLSKPSNIRLGNWEAEILTEAQIEYAATDAFVSWYLYHALKSLPDPADTSSEEVGKVAQQ